LVCLMLGQFSSKVSWFFMLTALGQQQNIGAILRLHSNKGPSNSCLQALRRSAQA